MAFGTLEGELMRVKLFVYCFTLCHNQSFFPISADVDSGSERACIELEAIEAIVKTASKAKFFIEFHSRCLEGIRYLLCNNQSG